MAVAKMKFLSLSGSEDLIDRTLALRLSECPIELVDAKEVLKGVEEVTQFDMGNPYEQAYKIYSYVKAEFPDIDFSPKEPPDEQTAFCVIDEVNEKLKEFDAKIKKAENEKAESELIVSQLEPMRGTNAELEKIFDMEYVEARYGRMPKEYFEKVKTFLTNIDAIYIPVYENKDYAWLMYFAPDEKIAKADRIFNSMYFERITVSKKAYGQPEKAYEYFVKKSGEHQQTIEDIKAEKRKFFTGVCDDFFGAGKLISTRYKIRNLRKYAAKTNNMFYICGWVTEKDFLKIKPKLDEDKSVMYEVSDGPETGSFSEPPIKLENKKIFKPFEWFLEMYALPRYNEFDPTVLMAITYTLIFGVMFGDVGHGLCLSLIGGLLYKFKKVTLGKIMIPIGISSAIFGVLYGSVFGNEEILPALLIRPMENSTSITTMLYSTVGLGGIIILMSMIANIINGIRQKDIKRIFFSQNGVAGMIMYGGILAGIVSMLMKKSLFTPLYIILVIVLPIIVIFLQDPLAALVCGKKDDKFSMVDNSFEFLEIMLSFVTNTISFIRIGAFALNHAGMMMAVFVISGMFRNTGSVITLVLGNALVMVLEGLVVGIQVLRLEFFEMFSRYYTGGGKKFTPVEID